MSPAKNLIADSRTTPAGTWRSWGLLERLPRISRDQLLPAGHRLVVVAPHPDDEVLACGGLLASLASADGNVLISVTDGEGSHPDSPISPECLRAVRQEESRAALMRLGLDLQRWHWCRLHLPDGGVDASVLADQLREMILPGDRLISTWRGDGHCDHEATGHACAQVAAQRGAQHYETPIWAWHWSAPDDPRVPWARACRFDLDQEAVRRKRDAILAHTSQCEGPQPVLSACLLDTLLQPYEIYFR
ncbi:MULTISPECIES: PIG-L family deacetylase [unclassified Pseudomonas]|uniref:PIG-L deacetylase family protein n=1 Tax=unclassified Pseudomonas TaxID=196821 RepID=UPI00244ADDA6|nr:MULTISPECIES: PIG-L family deacetylase [unclassified Pseudomonas]MDG9924422.1 PIG-L family deacetylase [Pseudomonas sp. GD04045]MDH0035238.1 PIG-L family deacetylase [Pseudomonas sp. GD04019]